MRTGRAISMGDLSHNFSRHEFRCHGAICCAGTSAPRQTLVIALQILRVAFNCKIRVNRGFSCNIHNKAVGGVFLGWHTRGGAADIEFEKPVETKALISHCKKCKEIGCLILYDTHIHVDIRPRTNGRLLLIDKRKIRREYL